MATNSVNTPVNNQHPLVAPRQPPPPKKKTMIYSRKGGTEPIEKPMHDVSPMCGGG